jgi:hypothetical protein
MPRTGVTYEQFLDAVTALQARDEIVNKVTVRRELGNTGSFGTIQTFLARWREEQGLPQASTSTSTRPIPESVGRLLAGAWEAARGEAREDLARERADLAANLAENEEALKTLDLQLQEREAQLEAQAAQAAQDLRAGRDQVAALTLKLGEAQGALSQTVQALQKVQADLEAQGSIRITLEAKAAALEAKFAALEADLRAATAREQASQTRIADQAKEIGILTGQAQAHATEKTALEARIRELEGKKG